MNCRRRPTVVLQRSVSSQCSGCRNYDRIVNPWQSAPLAASDDALAVVAGSRCLLPAAAGLEHMGEQAVEALPMLRQLARDDDARLRQSAQDAIRTLEGT